MSETKSPIDDDLRRRIEKLRLVARTVVQSFVVGQHRSAHKGFSIEFAEHRQYTRGDETRHIDWKVFGKSDRLFVKQYEEETNLTATLCLDASGSMGYRGSGEQKIEYARRLCAALAYLMIGQADSVGLVTFDNAVRARIPPRATANHLSHVLGELVHTEPGAETKLGAVLHELGAQLKRRGLVVIVSDFFGPIDELLQALAHFHHHRHEVILFQVLDPDEYVFPFEGVAEFVDLESGGRKIRLDAPRARTFYIERFDAFQKRLREICHRFHFDHVLMATDSPLESALSRYLIRRSGR